MPIAWSQWFYRRLARVTNLSEGSERSHDENSALKLGSDADSRWNAKAGRAAWFQVCQRQQYALTTTAGSYDTSTAVVAVHAQADGHGNSLVSIASCLFYNLSS